jgi:hypothetical protein
LIARPSHRPFACLLVVGVTLALAPYGAGCSSHAVPADGPGGGDAGGDGGPADLGGGLDLACDLRTAEQCLVGTTCAVLGCIDCSRTLVDQCVARAAVIRCPPLTCPGCEGRGEDACRGAPGCRAIYTPRDTSCTCTGTGCCQKFVTCKGGTPDCSGVVSCDGGAPKCDSPWVPSVADGCYEGCVPDSQCP